MRVGTRASALALSQARWVATQIEAAGPLASGPVELVEVTTAGDRGEHAADKSRWTSELERALIDGEIDLAVHSAKDVPVELAPGTEIAAIPAREDPRDVIVGAGSLDRLPPGARVGTGSLRRAAQLRALRDDLEIVELRGNVDTRLRKLATGEADAIVLAAAGLARLGRSGEAGGVLSELVPAPGQGALLVQARAGDASTSATARKLTERSAEECVLAERACARALAATCHTPLGAYAISAGARENAARAGVRLRAWIGLPDGSEWISDELAGPAGEVGEQLARRLISVGARELLARAEEMAVT